jgi:hypothetical protein
VIDSALLANSSERFANISENDSRGGGSSKKHVGSVPKQSVENDFNKRRLK